MCGNALTDVDVITCPEIGELPLHAVALEMVQIWIILQLSPLSLKIKLAQFFSQYS